MHPLFELFYKGLFLGMITAFSFGPIFFTIIETSVTRGYKWAISIAVGVLLSDAMIIAASFFSLGQLIRNEHVNNIVGATGGALLLCFGIYQLLKPVAEPKPVQMETSSHLTYLLYMVKGLAINTINPFVFIYWLSAVSIVTVDPDYNDAERIVFFAIAVLCNFGFDMLKTFLATRLKHIMTRRTMNFISKAVGCGIIYFGLRLLWKTVIM